MTDNLNSAKATLRKDFPDLEVKKISFLGQGWNNIAYLVNNEIVFRLPTERDGVGEERQQKVKMEVGLLKSVHGQLPVTTPLPLYVAPDNSYFGYGHLPGTNLEDRPEALNTEDKVNRFMKLWAITAYQIEKVVSKERALELGLEAFDSKEPLENVAYALENKLIPEASEYLARIYLEEFEARYAESTKRSITLHADMGVHSWLIDENSTPAALIDWTDAFIGPIEFQLGCWPWEMSAEKVSKAVEQYAKVSNYQPDERQVYLEYLGNAIGDIAYLVREGKPISDPGIQHTLVSLNYWTSQNLLK